MLVAGHETTAAALTWAWYELGRQPAIAERLYEEIDATLDGARIGFEHLPRFPYLEAFLEETLRLYPPA
jgi:cytochrome P450